MTDTKEFYEGARLLAPYNPEDPIYQQEITISVGGNKDSQSWRPDTMPISLFIHRLAEHCEGKKDGPAFVTGSMVGPRRLKVAMKTLSGVALDIDNGTSSETIHKEIVGLGCLAICYTTHSHGKTRSEFRKDALIKFFGDDDYEDDDNLRRFLREKEQWDEKIVASATYVGTDHTERGIMVFVEHAPMPKHRIVFPFAKPFVVADEAPTQAAAMEKWTRIPIALAAKLGVPLDKTGTDPSRLFYFPRHAKNRPWEITLVGGPLLDWETLELYDPLEQLAKETTKGSGKSKTPEGKELGRWAVKAADGFQIVDAIESNCPEKIRGKASSGVDIECPFDEDHSNPGDQEDRACFAVNAGEGSTDWFVVSCRHDTCRDKTMLDMLGKMLADGWFPRSVLEDDSFNALTTEDAPEPEVAKKIEKQDKAKADYKTAIDALTLDNVGDEIDQIAGLIAAAKLTPTAEAIAIDSIKKIAGTRLTKPAIAAQINAEKARLRRVDQSNKIKADAVGHGLAIFAYRGEYNFDDATQMCLRTLKQANEKAQLPIFCHVSGDLVRLNQTDKDGRLSLDGLSTQALWSELNNLVAFVRESDEEHSARQMVPKEVAAQVWEQGYLELPPAPEIVYTPVYTGDGSLMVSPGYWRDHDLLMADTGLRVADVPEEPTAEQMQEAVNWLKAEIFSDFPFLDYDGEGNERREPSEANAFAMLLTPFMRRMIDSCTPVFFVNKPTPGTGGTLLAMVPLLLFDGVESAPLRYTSNEEEMQKL